MANLQLRIRWIPDQHHSCRTELETTPLNHTSQTTDSKTKLPEYPSNLRKKTKTENRSTSQSTTLSIPLSLKEITTTGN